MVSVNISEQEFDDPRRLPLLTAISEALDLVDIEPTAWAYLWLCDINKLEELVGVAKSHGFMVQCMLSYIETNIKPVQQCRFTSIHLPVLINLSRDSKDSHIFSSNDSAYITPARFFISAPAAWITSSDPTFFSTSIAGSGSISWFSSHHDSRGRACSKETAHVWRAI
jgi:hypothetical protein